MKKGELTMSRIEQIISDIESYIDNCKFQPLSNTKIIVNKDQLEDMLNELRLKTPEEVKKYQKILNNKDAIIADAKEQAETIVNAAQIRTEELINEHEIMQRAYAQANALIEQATAQAQQILDNATNDANQIRIGAIHYTDDLLSQAESAIGRTLDTYTSKYDSLVNSLQECYDMVRNNRAELDVPPETEQSVQSEYPQDEYPADEYPQNNYEQDAYGQDDYLDDENQYPNDMSVSGYDIQEDDTLD